MRTAGAAVLAPPLGARLATAGARTLVGLPDRPIVMRMVRGRFWIALVASALLGIVAMQVSMLKLNAGISRALERIQTLQRENELYASRIARDGSVGRIQAQGRNLGLVMPPAGEFRYLAIDPRADGANALRELRAPLAPLEQVALPSNNGSSTPTLASGSSTPTAASGSSTPAAASGSSATGG